MQPNTMLVYASVSALMQPEVFGAIKRTTEHGLEPALA